MSIPGSLKSEFSLSKILPSCLFILVGRGMECHLAFLLFSFLIFQVKLIKITNICVQLYRPQRSLWDSVSSDSPRNHIKVENVLFQPGLLSNSIEFLECDLFQCGLHPCLHALPPNGEEEMGEKSTRNDYPLSTWLKTDQGWHDVTALVSGKRGHQPERRACWHCGAMGWKSPGGNRRDHPENLVGNRWRGWGSCPGCQRRVKNTCPVPALSGRAEAAPQWDVAN